jgi:hypothetical protein
MYKQLENNGNLSAMVAMDLDRIKSVFNYYDKPILYREDLRYYEFILDYKFIRNNIFYIHKIFERCELPIRIGKLSSNELIITIPKYDSVFQNN